MMVPLHLQTTFDLLTRSFPDGVSEPEYLAVLANLYPHMADENLAALMSEFAGKDVGVVLNDVLAVGGGEYTSAEVYAAVRAQLEKCGFEEWVKKDS